MASRARDEPLYFLHHDGRVFVVERGGVLGLPTRAEVPFPFAEAGRSRVGGRTVVFGAPQDKALHEAWPWRDELASLERVDAVARGAANLSMTRVVAKGAFTRGREVLLVKARIGYFKGRWSLPGGYVDYGESPEDCVRREVEEELGVRAEILRLLDVDSRVVESGLHFLSFLYEGRLASERFALKADEIEDARWFRLDAALREVGQSVSGRGLEALLREERPR